MATQTHYSIATRRKVIELAKTRTYNEVCQLIGLSVTTFYHILREGRVDLADRRRRIREDRQAAKEAARLERLAERKKKAKQFVDNNQTPTP